MNDIFSTFANLKSQSPESAEVQSNVQNWFDYLNSNINFDYTLDIFERLGHMYVEDERIKVNIDKFGAGSEQFIKDSTEVYVKNKQNSYTPLLNQKNYDLIKAYILYDIIC